MGDYIVRATAANNQIRAFAATTKELVETAEQHIIQVRWQQRHQDVFLLQEA